MLTLRFVIRGGVEGELPNTRQSGKFVVTPLDDTTLIESHKKGGQFHAFLLADAQCAMRLESFLAVFFPTLVTFSLPVVGLPSLVDQVNNSI